MTENAVKEVIYHWFSGFDQKKPASYFTVYLAETGLDMLYPPDVAIASREEFEAWLHEIQPAIVRNSHLIGQLSVSKGDAQEWQAEMDLVWTADLHDQSPVQQQIHQSWVLTETEPEKLIIRKLHAR